MKLKELCLLGLASFCLVCSVYLTLRASVTLGLFLMYGLTAALFLYLRFSAQIDRFCAHGPGRILAVLFWCGFAFFVFLVGLMELSPGFAAAPGDRQAVIVLGAGLRGEQPSDTLRRRLDAALAYYRAHPGCLLVLSGGQGYDEAVPEAEAMARWLKARGVPQSDLLLESRSASTEENFADSLAAMKTRGLDARTPVLYVTNRFHCYRAGGWARRVGFVDAAPLPTATSPLVWPAAAMREALAICAFWVSGA